MFVCGEEDWDVLTNIVLQDNQSEVWVWLSVPDNGYLVEHITY
jgi:hypothetical protein